MTTNRTKEQNSNDLILQMLKAKPKLKKSIEQQDSESLNTMDYYKEEGSNKNSLIDEMKTNNILLPNMNKNEKKIIKTENKDLSMQLNKSNKDIILNPNSHRKKSALNIQKYINIPKTPKDSKNICSNCNLNLGLSYRICPKCKKFFCKNCFYNLNNKDNNYINDISKEQENKNKTEKICCFCKNYNINNNNINNYKNKKHNMNKKLEPLDSFSEDEMKFILEKKENKKINKNENKMKSLKEQYNEYEEFSNKINETKKEIEIKKNICINILQMIKRAIEVEYEKNQNKLKELSIKLNKIKEDLNKMINLNNAFDNEVEMQINLDTYKNTLNSYSKIFDNYYQKILSRTIFRGFKLYESSNILINQSDIYFMKYKEIMTDFPFGNVYLKIDRFTNNYKNYLNFSTLIKQRNKVNSDMSFDHSYKNEINNKSRFIVNMIINNKVIRLNKSTKDNNDINISYESSEEENQLLFSKDKFNTNNYKVKDFNAKVIISEIIL